MSPMYTLDTRPPSYTERRYRRYTGLDLLQDTD